MTAEVVSQTRSSIGRCTHAGATLHPELASHFICCFHYSLCRGHPRLLRVASHVARLLELWLAGDEDARRESREVRPTVSFFFCILLLKYLIEVQQPAVKSV